MVSVPEGAKDLTARGVVDLHRETACTPKQTTSYSVLKT